MFERITSKIDTTALAYKTAESVDVAIGLGSRLVAALRQSVTVILRDPPDQDAFIVERLAYTGLRGVVDTAKNLHLIDPVNLSKLPQLSDDPTEDMELKRMAVRELMTGKGYSLPLAQELGRFASITFYRKIPPERLIDFFQNLTVLRLMLSQHIQAANSPSNATNAGELVTMGMVYISESIRAYAQRLDKLPVNAEIEASLRADIEYFKAHYDPQNKNNTVHNFMLSLVSPVQSGDSLEENSPRDYSDYDVATWLESHLGLIAQILHESDDQGHSRKPHIANMIFGAYEQLGQDDPERFIAIYLPRIISYQNTSGDAQFGVLQFNLQYLQEFFNEIVPRIQTPENTPVKLRKIILGQCRKYIEAHPGAEGICIVGSYPDTLAVRTDRDIYAGLEELVLKQTKILRDDTSASVDLESIAGEFDRYYKEFFDDSGVLPRAYNRHIRQMFELITIDPNDEEAVETHEKMQGIKARLSGIFEQANKYLDQINETLGLQSEKGKFPAVFATNSLSELVKIYHDFKGQEKGYLALSKYCLALSIYTSMYSPSFVERQHNAKHIKLRLEKSGAGLFFDPEEVAKTLYFIENQDGAVQEISSPDQSRPDGAEVKSVKLLPATFGTIPCYVLAARELGTDGIEAGEYLSVKSLFSGAIKRIRKRSKGEDVSEITDQLRMTLVADTPEQLQNIQEYIEKNYVSLGRALKRENRYGELVNVSTFQVSPNPSKAREYSCLRYVLYLPVPNSSDSSQFSLIPLELRILLQEDLLKEESTNNPASHEQYDRRRAKECFDILRPVDKFPSCYEEVPRDQHDRFRTKKYRLRTT